MTNVLRRLRAALSPSCIAVGLCLQPACATIVSAQSGSVAANAAAESPYESRFADVRGIRLHYLDFGGTGLPLIFVHDWYEDAHTWTTMAPLFADAYRVLAMTRRGYGQSDDVGWGYDVATQAEDILGFMDALGIERAVLVGRHPTTQDMTWIAEHHPQRLAGLVYLYHAVWPSPGDARILRDRTFAEMFNRYGGCWMGEEAYERAAPRLLYRPHYIDDERRRIDVPALSFTHPQDLAAGMGGLDLLDLTLEGATSADPGGGFCDVASIEASVAWLTALARDTARLAAARALVPTSAERRGYAEAFERAFGSNLRVVRLDGPADYRTDPEAYHSHIRRFLAGPVGSDTVDVGPPTGARQVDRASILAALPAEQEGEPIVIGQRLTLRSDILGEDRQILVRVPDGYERGNARYPVIYVLDGEFHFLHVSGATRVLGDRIPTMIVVGVENVDRDRDLTPPIAGDPFVIPVPFSADTVRFQLDTAAGRADDFLRFLHEELAPFIDGRYRTAPFRVLFGHSLGGLFTTHAFLTRPESFNAWIASSPSLAYYRSALDQRAPERLTTDAFEGRFFFSTVGEEEPWNVWGDGTIAWAFERFRPAGLRWWHRVLPGESHGTVPYRTAFDGLRTIFSDFAVPFPTLEAGDLRGVEAHFARASATYRYEIAVPEFLLHGMGHERLGFGDAAGAIRIFRRNVELHPASPGVYDALADALEADGQLHEALRNRAEALRRAEQQGDARLETFRRSLEALRARMTGASDTGTGNRIAGPVAAVDEVRARTASLAPSQGVQRQPDTVHVAAPTGERVADRASILEALAQVQPGGTVQFAPGTYLVGRFIDVAVPRITLVGHPDGTTIRGCEPAGFADMGVAMAQCNGFNLTGGGQTVRALAFEHTWHALVLGGLKCEGGVCRPDSPPIESRTGGYVVEGSTFRESQNGIRVVGEWSEPAVIRDNRFINTYHAVVVNGMTAHIADNLISVPDPERVPYTRHPGGALAIMGWDAPDQAAFCDNNVIVGNRITGHPDAILIAVAPGGTCRGNEIRDNIIESYPVRFTSPSTALTVRSAADSTVTGVPIALLNGVFGDGTIENNLIEGNRIVGASGLAVQVTRASRNRIVNNTISGVASRVPFPGNTLFSGRPGWGEANGSGIWISPGSVANEIVGNTFADIAQHAVVVEGDRNIVETRSGADDVRDLGSGNRVSLRPAGPTTGTRGAAVPLDGDRLFMIRPDGRPLFGGIRRLEMIPDAAGEFHLEFWGGLVQFQRGVEGALETLVYVPPPRMPAAYRQPLRYAKVR